MHETKLINLTAEEILALIKEKSIQREGVCIASNSSFLAILSLLDEEMAKDFPMFDQRQHDRLIAKLQHFQDMIQRFQSEKEILLLTMDRESCEKDQIKSQIFLCQQIANEYYEIFQDILYR